MCVEEEYLMPAAGCYLHGTIFQCVCHGDLCNDRDWATNVDRDLALNWHGDSYADTAQSNIKAAKVRAKNMLEKIGEWFNRRP